MIEAGDQWDFQLDEQPTALAIRTSLWGDVCKSVKERGCIHVVQAQDVLTELYQRRPSHLLSRM